MQFIKTLAAFSALLSASSAYLVLTPTANQTVAKGQPFDVTWSTVDTDPTTFSIYLSNFVTYPPTLIQLALDIPQEDLSYSVTIPCDVASGSGWRLDFLNGTNEYVIYAQSAVFSLSGNCVSPTTSSSVAVPTTVYLNNTLTTTTTATVTQVAKTVTIPNPIIWFVNTETTSACTQQGEKTVTVYASGPAPTSTIAVGAHGHNTTATVGPTGTGKSRTTSTGAATFTGAAAPVKVGGAMGLIGLAGAALLL